MKNLPSLRNLELVDLMLDAEEALTFLDHLCYTHCLIMERLTVVNISKTQCELLHLGMFLNLQVIMRHFLSIFDLNNKIRSVNSLFCKIYNN